MEPSETEQKPEEKINVPVSSVMPFEPSNKTEPDISVEVSPVEAPLPPTTPVLKKKSSAMPAFLIFIALLLLLGGAVLFLWQTGKVSIPGLTPVTEDTATPSEEAVPVTKVTTPAVEEVAPIPEESSPKDEALLIKVAMAEKYSRDSSDISLGVREMTTEYAAGSIKFAGEISGGWWLAAKVEGAWVIVADGNGTVMCSDVASYSFPKSMVPECYDESTGALTQF